ncbi:MAG TPA: aquaporin [Planctomycetota bacterium]
MTATALQATPEGWRTAALLDGLGLGVFMVSAACFATLLEWPGSPLRAGLEPPLLRRLLMGFAMGLTAVALIYSPLGKRSGAHLNPATTVTFWRLGRVAPRQAVGYVLAQFAGGAAGLALAALLLGPRIAAPEVHFVATVPGAFGHGFAFVAELAMTFVLMSIVLRTSQSRRWNRWTGVVAGSLVALYITVEAPISGMSLNPARTFASALLARDFTGLWIYFMAPLCGMLLAAEWFVRLRGEGAVRCAKLHHDNPYRCTFRCRWGCPGNAGGRAASKGT